MTDKRFSWQLTVEHNDILELLDAYSTGELTPEESRLIERHLEDCESCRQFLQDVQHLHTLFAAQTGYHVFEIPSVSEAVMQEIQESSREPLLPLHPFEKLPQPAPRKRRLMGALLGLAAVLLVGILVGSYLVFAALLRPVPVGRPDIATPTPMLPFPTPTQPAPIPTPAPNQGALTQNDILWTLHMFDQNTGWATNKSGILRTSDGGNHWQQVSPLGNADFGLGTAAFLSPQVAWLVTIDPASNQCISYSTGNGGQTWLRGSDLASISGGGPGVGLDSLSVISAQEAWIFSTVGGQNGLHPVLLHSLDGGQHWSSQSVNAPVTTNEIKGLFVDSTTGWFMSPGTKSSTIDVLFVTHDGGKSWQVQKLDLPANVASANLELPIFLNKNDAILPMVYTLNGASHSDALVYVTHDGGASWRATVSQPLKNMVPLDRMVPTFWAITAQTWGFSEVSRLPEQDGSYQDHPLIHITQDGGQSWSQVTSDTLLQVIGDVSLFSLSQGYALGVPGKASLNVAPLPEGTLGKSGGMLLKTQDGGKTWQPVPLHVG